MPDLATLLDRFRQGDRLALSRLLSLAARGELVADQLAALPLPSTSPKVVALTGSAGVGKSTLIGKLIGEIRNQGQKVAVLACDPQSPLTGGALLGDRFRMPGGDSADDGVFIRSLAALSGHGAVADHLPIMVRLLGAFGFKVVLIETVGAGQGDVAVADLAAVVVLLLQPETGDDLQWEKAGVLEVADILVVQKADLPRAEQMAAQVRAAQEFDERVAMPVLLVSAKTGQGVSELWQAIAAVPVATVKSGHPSVDLLQVGQVLVMQHFNQLRCANDRLVARLTEQVQRKEISTNQAVAMLLHHISQALQQLS